MFSSEFTFCVILLFISFSYCNVWYISPFGNNQNSGTSPGYPFLDLKTALIHSSYGDTIYVESGSYSGSSNIYLTLNGVRLIGTSGSQETSFVGDASSRVDYIFALTNGATVQGVSVSTAEIGFNIETSTSLSDISINDMNTGGITSGGDATSIDLTSVSFTNSNKGIKLDTINIISTLTVNYSYFSNCSMGIYITSSRKFTTITIINSEFNGNDNEYAIYYSSTATNPISIDIQNSTIQNYYNDHSGAGIFVSGTNLSLNLIYAFFSNISCNSGAPIYINGSVTTNVNSCSFINNDGNDSGVLSINTDSPTTVSNSNFENNLSRGNGAAISASSRNGGKNLTLINSYFSNNTAHSAGTVYSSVNLTVEGCNFVSNFGTGIYFYDNVMNIVDSMFSGNIGSSGGAINYHSAEHSTISSSHFVDNTADYYGGAIYQQTNGGSILSIEKSTFESNSAEYGGAITINESLNLLGVSFKENSATYGGGLNVERANTINITLSTFNDNFASQNGGGFYCENGDLYLNYDNFNGNEANEGSAFDCGGCDTTKNVINVNPNNSAKCN